MKGLIVLLVSVIGFEAFANSAFIPNHHRGRREMNGFSAIGWSNRKEVGGRLTRTELKNTDAGVTEEEQDTTAIAPYIFLRTPENVTFESTLTYGKGENKDLTGTPTTTDIETQNVQLSGGYQVSESFAFGGTLLHSDTDYESSTSNINLEAIFLAVGGSYRLPSNVYLGIGLVNLKTEFGTTEDSDNTLALGLGYVAGDQEKPTATFELLFSHSDEDDIKSNELVAEGLVNVSDFQFVGSLSRRTDKDDGNDGTDDGQTISGLELGLDYQFGNYFLGPQVEFTNEDEKDDTDADEKATNLSLQAGYRANQLEFYLEIGRGKSKLETPSTGSEEENESSSVTLAGAYFF